MKMLTNALMTAFWSQLGNRGMLVCPVVPEKKLAFVAIPKNAGTSIRVAFGVAQGFLQEGEKVVSVSSKRWPSVKSKEMINLLGFLGFHRFSVARNPWERFVSCWQDKLNNESFLRKSGGLFRRDMDFPSFAEAAFSVPNDKADRHYRSQLSFISNRGKVLVDRIVRFEKLGSDWEVLRQEFDLPALPHHKQTGATDSYLELYEKYPETKELVTHRYRQDIEYLGYDFE